MTAAAVQPHTQGGLTSAFAYLRRLPGMDDAAVREAVTAVTAFSVRQGLSLAGIHYEERPSERLDTWMELITSCRSEAVSNVLVLSADHFHHDPIVAAYMCEELAEKIRGTVWLVTETTTTNQTAPALEADGHDC
ncbi:hypothetical protein SAMN05216251_13344 [Actinacidiphila alni]|uniref:Resolvase/invertase-type recombinase catalytic domain-containing protein n=1 Tax=Actinacidiphila alni TaxID=380248 RepID=A0A1I2M6Y0_9ACTN|nr:hypothetical protein [Actinacidiphila alni]SFF87232.1 hypothetical protein SAMN05216251_13344 [Actinacidiphila alni]